MAEKLIIAEDERGNRFKVTEKDAKNRDLKPVADTKARSAAQKEREARSKETNKHGAESAKDDAGKDES